MRLALVTGASSGIGAKLAKLLCDRGYHVIGVARSLARLRALRDELSECFEYIAVDLAARESIELIERRVADYGYLDMLVNNAGYAIPKPVVSHSVDEIENLFLVNAVRPLQLITALIKYMKRGSIIVNVVTAGIYVEMTRFPIYGAAKSALHYASRILKQELRARGIRVIDVYPGPVKTRFFERIGVETPRNAVDPEVVAKAIIDAIERGANTVYVPRYLRILALLSRFPLPIRF